MKAGNFPFLILLAMSLNAYSMNPFTYIDGSNGETILTIHRTATPSFKSTFRTELYAGKSVSAPCSDLSPIFSSTYEANARDETRYMTSADIVQYMGGEGITCIRNDMIVVPSGHSYSTGNILLTWDATTHKYLSAEPNQVQWISAPSNLTFVSPLFKLESVGALNISYSNFLSKSF